MFGGMRRELETRMNPLAEKNPKIKGSVNLKKFEENNS